MTAYNVVRFRTKPGMENAFIEAHEMAALNAAGLRKAALVKTGDRAFCFIGKCTVGKRDCVVHTCVLRTLPPI